MNALQAQKRINALQFRLYELERIISEHACDLTMPVYASLCNDSQEYRKDIKSLTLIKIAEQKKEGKGIHFTIDKAVGLDSGYCRLYLRDTRNVLHCLQVGGNNRLELYICSKDGEPAYQLNDYYCIHNGQYMLDYYDIQEHENFFGLRAANKAFLALTDNVE